MASPPGTASFSESGFSPCPSFAVRPHARAFPMANSSSICVVNCCLGKSTKILKQQNPIFFAATPRKNRGFTSHRSLELEQFVTSDDEDEMGDGFFEAIEELERMTREPSDVLEEMNNRLSARELQLVLVYFSQEGRDSWCALEVFEWLKKENRVDEETMELMVAIMCGWMRKLIEGEHEVNDVADLLVDMDCVGLKPSFSMFEKVISLYWEMEKKEKAVSFVKEVLRRGTMYSEGNGNDDEGHKGGPTGYLAWKMMVSLSYPSMCRGLLLVDDAITDLYVMSVTSDCLDTLMVMPFLSKRATQELSAKILSLDLVTLYCSKEVDGKYRDAVKLVIEIRESGLKPEVYSYLIAMTAIVKELNEVAKALRKLKGFAKSGLVASIDAENVGLVEQYRSDLLSDGVCLSKWVLEEGSPSIHGVVHERLLAMYICAGQGLEAESQLWQMKLVGKETDGDLRDIVLAICASQNEVGAIRRLLARSEVASSARKRKTFSWLLRGFIKGGHFNDAADTLLKMLDMGLYPDYLDRVAVLQGLRNGIQRSGDVDLYLNVCKRLADAHLIGPCLVYLHIKKHNLWIMRML